MDWGSVFVLSQNGLHTWNTSLASVVAVKCRVVWPRLSGALALAPALISHVQVLHIKSSVAASLPVTLCRALIINFSDFFAVPSLEFLFMDLVFKQKYDQCKPFPVVVIWTPFFTRQSQATRAQNQHNHKHKIVLLSLSLCLHLSSPSSNLPNSV